MCIEPPVTRPSRQRRLGDRSNLSCSGLGATIVAIAIATWGLGCSSPNPAPAAVGTCSEADAQVATVDTIDTVDASDAELDVGSDLDAGADSASLTNAEVKRRLRTAECLGRASCRGSPLDLEYCVGLDEGWSFPSQFTVEEKYVLACEQAWRTCAWSLDDVKGPDACRLVIRGQQPLGAACTNAWSCKEGVCALQDLTQGPCSRICVPLGGRGDACFSDNGCGDSLACVNGKCNQVRSGRVSDSCDPGHELGYTNESIQGCGPALTCDDVTAKCIPRHAAGKFCSGAPVNSCGDGLECLSSTCHVLLPIDATCETDGGSGKLKAVCGTGLTCVNSGAESRCAPWNAKQPGESCLEDAECGSISGHRCTPGPSGSTCQPVPDLGQACMPSVGCRGYLQCIQGKCAELQFGDPCDESVVAFCSDSLICRLGKCQFRSPLGHPCKEDWHCDSDLHCGEKFDLCEGLAKCL